MTQRPSRDPARGGPQAPCVLGIMTKAPLAGRVKTRLTPPLSPAEAAALHVCFLRDTADSITAACRTACCDGAIVYTPAGTEALFDPLVPSGFRRVLQRGETLGDRLCGAAIDLREAGYTSVCLIDSDSPTVPPAILAKAAALLDAPDRVVLGPADDGGYYLIGMTTVHPPLFANVEWGTEAVFAQTVARAAEAGLRVETLPSWYDVDNASSLRRLCGDLFETTGRPGGSSHGYPAPHTRRYLAELLTHARERVWPPSCVTGRRGDRTGAPR